MTPEQYERVEQLFHEALATAPERRRSFIDQACNGKDDLRAELFSLLAAHEHRAALTEKPLDDIAAAYLAGRGSDVASAAAPLAAHTRLDRYEIRSLLGKGGMGEVYLAEDMRLHRKVALKILPSAMAANQDRMRRFEQEATSAAALNHPHIAHIYEIGESEGTHFIALEYVEGETLRDRIHSHQTSLKDLLKSLIQVAQGLTKAHEAGIVHRDLKPDNIMITLDGYAKILDFGLAKLIGTSEPASATTSGAAATAQHSLAGMVMGTAGYMSPEQSQGKVDEIDHRSDIFSFGCILFEAATGKRPFADESVISSLRKVANEAAPPIKDLNPTAPPALDQIVQRCLAKDPRRRYQNIRDVAVALEEVRQGMTAAGAQDSNQLSSGLEVAGRQTDGRAARFTSSAEYIVHRVTQNKTRAIIAAALVTIVIATLVWILSRSGRGNLKTTRPVVLKRLTPDIYAQGPALSPHGEYLAYVKLEKGLSSIWLRDMASDNTVQTMPPSAEGYGGLQFSPDGKQIYYLTSRPGFPNNAIARVPLFGGPAEYVATDSISPFAFSPHGDQIAFVRYPSLVIASTEGKGERDLLNLTGSNQGFVAWGSQLSWSPDGTKIAICGESDERGKHRAELLEVSVSDGTRRILPTPDWNAIDDAIWLADGASLLVTAREKEGEPYQIWRVQYPGGESTRVTNDTNGYDDLSLTADSHTLVARQTFSHQNVWLASLPDSKNAQQLTFSNVAADGYSGLAFAPDGSIIFTSPRTGNVDLWRMDGDGSNQQRITEDAGNFNGNPRVTPDGRYIVFVSTRSGIKQIWRMDADGKNPMRLTDSLNGEDLPYLSPDGQWIYFMKFDDRKPVVLKVSINGGSPELVFGDIDTFDAIPSPDGRLFACGVYIKNSDKPWKIAIMSSAGGRPIKLLDTPAYRGIKRWSQDSKSLIYFKGGTGELWQQPIDGSPPTKLYTLSNERLYNFSISPDFKKIIYSLGNEYSEAVLLSNFSQE